MARKSLMVSLAKSGRERPAAIEGEEVAFTQEEEEAADADDLVHEAARQARMALAYREVRAADFVAELGDIPNQSLLLVLADQLDACMKQFEALAADGVALEPDLAAKIAKWRAIKNRHPKPAAAALARS